MVTQEAAPGRFAPMSSAGYETGSISNLLPALSARRQPVEISTPLERSLTETQIDAIRSAMKLFVEDDLARGVTSFSRVFCDACEQARPAAGVIQYDRYCLCNRCAIEYEAGRARGIVSLPGQYVRDKHFGDGDFYLLPD